jgi:hypothetical protein
MPITRRQFLGAGVAVGASLVLAWHFHGTHSLGVYNVQDYGAVGDGSTDDTAAIDAAITAAGSEATVFFPAGTYMHDSTWHITSPDLRLLGQEGAVLKKRTTTNFFIAIDAARVTLENLTLDMNTTTFTTTESALLSISPGSDDCHLHNCRFVDFGYYGVSANGDSSNIARTRITDCYFEVDYAAGTGPGNGVSFGFNGSDWEVSGCTFIITGPNSGGVGVGMNEVGTLQQRGVIANNTFEMPSGSGTDLRCPISVVHLGGASLYPREVTIVGNTITCATEMFGFMSLDMRDGAVVDNVCRMTGTAATLGFELVDCDHVTCVGNTIDGGGVVPSMIMVNNTSGCVFDGNILRNPAPGSEAIRVYSDNQYTTDASRNVIANNKITIPGTSTAGGISLIANGTSANIDDTIVAHNHIDGNSNASGIRLELLFGSIARSLVHGNNLRTLANAFVMYGATADSTFTDNVLSGITATQRFVGDPGSATGVSVIDNTWQFANAAPIAEYHFVGERVWKSSPSGSNPMGWICTTAGTPGTWTASRKRTRR